MSKKSAKRYVYVCEYEGNAIYEPAEGGYYVEVSQLVRAERMSFHHAKRRLRQFAGYYLDDGFYEGYCGTTEARIRTGCHVGDFIEYRITRNPEAHEIHYHGYC